MMTQLQYFLGKLAEEGTEIAQISLKTQQFGLNETYEILSNKELCHLELDDLGAIIEILNEKFNFGFTSNFENRRLKKIKVQKYLDYAISLGNVEAI